MTLKSEVLAAMGKLRSLSKRDGVSEANRECVEIIRAELLAMDARLAEALKDARRYRWLRERVDWKPQPEDASGKVYLVATMVSAVYGDTNDQTDAAIDKAMHNSAREVE